MSRLALKPVLFFALTLLFSSVAFAQDSIPSLMAKPQRPDNFWRRVNIGGNLGFQFGSVTAITVAPEVRIRTVDQLYVGFRFIYQYINNKDYFMDTRTGQTLSYQSNVFGGSIYLRYYLSSLFDNFLSNVFAHIEYEHLVYEVPYVQTPGGSILGIDGLYYAPGNAQVRYNSFFVGGGYRQPVGNHVSMDLLLLFNLNDTYNSPYSNPIFRLGVGVGL